MSVAGKAYRCTERLPKHEFSQLRRAAFSVASSPKPSVALQMESLCISFNHARGSSFELETQLFWQSSYNTHQMPIQRLCWNQSQRWHAVSQV
jgi:hypothetical protein